MNEYPKRTRKWDDKNMRTISTKVLAEIGTEFREICEREHVTPHRALMCYVAMCIERGGLYLPTAAEHAADMRRRKRRITRKAPATFNY